MDDHSTIEKACSLLKEHKGVCSVVGQLNKSQQEKILKMELEEQKKSMMLNACSENQSVKEVLSRDVVLLLTNDQNYEYKQPTILLKAGDEVVGEEIMDKAKLEELKHTPGCYALGSDMIVYTRKLRQMKGVPLKFVTLPFCLTDEKVVEKIEALPGVQDLICGWPSRSVDFYLKNEFRMKTDDLRIGTLLVGFDLRK
jgi:hypothetical protein